MAHKELLFNEEARRAHQPGVNTHADAVKVTLGPKRRDDTLDATVPVVLGLRLRVGG